MDEGLLDEGDIRVAASVREGQLGHSRVVRSAPEFRVRAEVMHGGGEHSAVEENEPEHDEVEFERVERGGCHLSRGRPDGQASPADR